MFNESSACSWPWRQTGWFLFLVLNNLCCLLMWFESSPISQVDAPASPGELYVASYMWLFRIRESPFVAKCSFPEKMELEQSGFYLFYLNTHSCLSEAARVGWTVLLVHSIFINVCYLIDCLFFNCLDPITCHWVLLAEWALSSFTLWLQPWPWHATSESEGRTYGMP